MTDLIRRLISAGFHISVFDITAGIFKNIMSKSVEKLQNENLLGGYICIKKGKKCNCFHGG